MAAKDILVLCAQALLIQCALSQSVNRGWGFDGPGYDGFNLNRGLGCPGPMDYTPQCGGALPISSSSHMVPTGITVVSENVFEGTLSVIGELPFIGAVALEGSLPSSGSGAINFGCGNGASGIVSEGPSIAVGNPFASGFPPGYGYGDILH